MACPSCGVPAPAGARFCGSCGSSLERRSDERRLVSVLFADLVGYTSFAENRDPEAVKNLVDTCFERLVADVVAFGGVVDKIIGDAIVALFGAPVAHEDDPERAVRAALRMQQTLAEESDRAGVDLRMRVGINTGEVLVGTLRAGGDYTAMGDVVNTASRLQVLARPGQVLVGPATHAATDAAFTYESLGLLRAKGREEPVPAWVAVEALGQPGTRQRCSRAPLVGRDAELGLLRQALTMTETRRRAGIVLLLGEAGAGKTRLADELVTVARGEGMFVLEGRCVPYGEVNVWAPIAEALRRAAGAKDDDDQATVERKYRTAVAAILDLPEDAPEVKGLMHGLSPVMGKSAGHVGSVSASGARPDQDTTSAEGEAVMEEVLRPVAQCLEHLCGHRTLVFVIGELHWADDILLTFLDRLLERIVDLPLLLIATARPELTARWEPQPGRHNRTVLHVDALDRESAATLLEHLAGPGLTAEQRDLLVERSGGNPLWLEELAALTGEQVSLPATLRGMVAARLDQLDTAARELLEDAAVCGRSGMVATLVGMAEAAGRRGVEAALDDVGTAGLLAYSDGRTAWELRSDLVREVAYGTLTKGERARRHARLAQWLSDKAGSDPRDDILDDLAHHWSTAAALAAELGQVTGMPSNTVTVALEWVAKAAERAARQEMWLSAAALLDTALDLSRQAGQLTSVDRRRVGSLLLGRARARAGTRDAAGASADLAALDAMAPDDDLRTAALIVSGDVHRMQGRMAESERVLLDALELARKLGDSHNELLALRSLGQSRLFAGDTEGAAEAAEQALDASRRVGDRQGEAWALQHLAWTAFSRGDMITAKERLHDSVEAFEEIADRGGRAWAEGLLAWVTLSCGDLEGALALGQDALAEALEAGDRWAMSIMRTLIANAKLWLGSPAEAVVEAEMAVTSMAEMDEVWGSVQARMVLGRSQLAVGDVDLGIATLQDAVAAAGRLDDKGTLRMAQAVVVVALALQIGQSEAALAASELVHDMPPGFVDELQAATAVAYLQLGRIDDASRAIAPLLGWEAGGADEMPHLRPAVAPWVALVLAAAGRVADGVGVLDAVQEEPAGTFLDNAWMDVARLALAKSPEHRAKVQVHAGIADRLARRNIAYAATILDGGNPPPAPEMAGWRRLWESVA